MTKTLYAEPLKMNQILNTVDAKSLWQPSHHADTSACLLWYSGIRFAWSPRSGTNNLFNPLIIIRGINKFGMGGCTLNLEPLPWAEIYLFTIFPPCCLVTKGATSLPLPLLWSLVRVCSESINWIRCCQSTYAIFRDTVSILTNVFFHYSVWCISLPIYGTTVVVFYWNKG